MWKNVSPLCTRFSAYQLDRSSYCAEWLQDVRTKAALELLERLGVAQQEAEPATAPERSAVCVKALVSGKARLQAAEQSLAACAPLVVRHTTFQDTLRGHCVLQQVAVAEVGISSKHRLCDLASSLPSGPIHHKNSSEHSDLHLSTSAARRTAF